MIVHTVSEGETIFSIANRYQITENRIRTDNGLLPNQELVVGQSLLILLPSVVYTVQPNDTLNAIAGRYQTTLKTLLRNNPTLSLTNTLYAGQTVVISYEGEKRGSILTNGYVYPFVRPNDLRQVLPYLSMITPFTRGIREDGTLVPLSDENIREAAQEVSVNWVLIISTLDENDRFNSELPGRIFANTETTNRLISEIVTLASNEGFRYIDIDFEFLPAVQAQNYARFIAQLREEANERGIQVIVALAPKTSRDQPGLLYEGHLYNELGRSADFVLLMTYEWGYTYGPPQAVAPINKVRQVVEYAITEIPSQKILLGMPNYGYDWTLPFEAGVSRANSIGNVDAVRLAEEFRREIQFDSIAMTPYFYYTDNDGLEHAVWFEDIRSVLAKLNLISEFDLAGFSVWNVMRWFPALWLGTNALYEIEE